MAKIIIFGIRDFAELAHYYFSTDTEHEVVAFTVNSEYLNIENFKGLPVVPFENIENIYSVQDHLFFAPISATRMNSSREHVYTLIKSKGYKFINYISSKATIFDNVILGDNLFIFENNVIQPFVSIGNNVIFWSGNHIGHHSIIHNHVMFTSHVVLSGHCVVNSYSYFGVNSTIRDNINIAKGTFVAMSAAIIKDTEEFSLYAGIPAKKIRQVDFQFDF